jgi:glycine cleavage system H protein
MDLPNDLKYTDSHEWIRTESDGSLTIGITDHAQAALGDLVFVELPKPGRSVGAGEACAVVESVKAASDVYAPLAGTIVAGNDALASRPEAVNENAYAAWLFRIQPEDAADVQKFMDAAAYSNLIAEA